MDFLLYFSCELISGFIGIGSALFSTGPTPEPKQEPISVRIAKMGIFVIGFSLLTAAMLWGMMLFTDWRPRTSNVRMSINGIPLSQADANLCAGPNGCPQGVLMKYMARSR
ncbi:MAG: hypothetical protein EOO38_30240 [Cytophagaceae bacterium]|nr:MAG: hypothetical protein EOO38_30240 [Cytophagaceae bacterium]